MRIVKGGCFVSKLPNHICMKELPPECIETNVDSPPRKILDTDLSQSGHEQLLVSFR